MNQPASATNRGSASRWGILLGIAGLVIAGLLFPRWWPPVSRLLGAAQAVSETVADSDEHEGEHNHDHAGHDESSSIEVSEQAKRNIGLQTGKVRLSTFTKTITIPAMIVQQRGRTETRVVAPLTGLILKTYAIEGESLRPGQPLFDLRLTHEDLVQSQVEFLRVAEELDVVKREIARLKPGVSKGAVPAKTLLDRKYEQDRLEASQRAQREALLLHGLSESQVDSIIETRKLMSTVTISVPTDQTIPVGGGAFISKSPPAGSPAAATATPDSDSPPIAAETIEAEKEPATASPTLTNQPSVDVPPADSDKNSDLPSLLVVQQLQVETGRLVSAGDLLCTLADYRELYIEGQAFEQDAQAIGHAVQNDWAVTCLINGDPSPGHNRLENLPIFYVADQISPLSRTLPFYVVLNNVQTRDTVRAGHRFISWRFKPGQRVQLLVPVDRWPDRIILPADAVVQDGAEWYVFQQNGDHFDRRPVHVEYRDLQSAVIAQDGSLFPGEVVAMSGAQQLQMALKNKSGGPVDPHAGHNH